MMQSKVIPFGVYIYPFEEKDSSVLVIAPRVNDVSSQPADKELRERE